MKQPSKILLAFLMIAFVSYAISACSKENAESDVITYAIDEATKSSSEEQTKLDAKTIAEYFMISSSYDVSLEEVMDLIQIEFPSKTVNSITPRVEDGVILYFEVTFERGGALLSGDKRCAPVLCFDEDKPIDIIGTTSFNTWLDSEIDIIRTVKKNNPDISNENTLFWSSIGKRLRVFKPIIDEHPETKAGGDSNNERYVWARLRVGSMPYGFDGIDVPHLLQTEWGRFDPWNRKVPTHVSNNGFNIQCEAGALAVALGQCFLYSNVQLNSPTFSYLIDSLSFSTSASYNTTIPPQNGKVYELNSYWTSRCINNQYWANMPLRANQVVSSQEVTELIADIGSKVGQKYYVEESTSTFPIIFSVPRYSYIDKYSLNNILQVCSQYGINSSMSSFSDNIVLSELSNNRPVLTTSEITPREDFYFENNNEFVDSWVIDGAKNGTQTYKIEYMWLKVPDPNGILIPWEDQIEEGDPNIGEIVIDSHYEGELEYAYETESIHYYRVNWGLDGEKNNVLVTIGASTFLGESISLYYPSRTMLFYNIEGNINQ